MSRASSLSYVCPLPWLEIDLANVQLHSDHRQDDLKPVQPAFEATLLSLLTSATPKPGRPLRTLIARCIITVHKRSENRSLFDFVQEILKVASTDGPKGKEVDREVRV